MNLEVPKKYKGVLAGAYGAAEIMMRPYSRKYDLAEHTFPKPLGLLAKGLDAINDATGGAIDGASSKVDKKDDSNKNGGNMASCLNIQGIGYGDVGMLLTFPGQGLGNAAIAAVANEEQLKRFGGKWAAMAITEPNFGSDSAAICATAVKDGDEYILNGEKIFITAGERCDVVVVWATLDKSLGRAAIKSFVVEHGTPGMHLDRVEKKLGIRASDTAAIVFTDCRVPAANVLGSPEIDIKKGFAGVMETFDNTRPFVGAMSLGVQQATLERTKEILSKTGKVDLEDFKTPINKAPAAQATYMRMEADHEAARLFCLLYTSPSPRDPE